MQMWMWLTLALLLAGAEIFTAGFGLLWFGLAAIVAAGLAFLGVGLGGQLVAFGLTGLILLYYTKRIVHRVPGRNIRTNIEAMQDRVGIVLEALAPGRTGYIQVGNEHWPAQSSVPIPEGMPVLVRRVEGVTLLVEPLEPAKEG